MLHPLSRGANHDCQGPCTFPAGLLGRAVACPRSATTTPIPLARAACVTAMSAGLTGGRVLQASLDPAMRKLRQARVLATTAVKHSEFLERAFASAGLFPDVVVPENMDRTEAARFVQAYGGKILVCACCQGTAGCVWGGVDGGAECSRQDQAGRPPDGRTRLPCNFWKYKTGKRYLDASPINVCCVCWLTGPVHEQAPANHDTRKTRLSVRICSALGSATRAGRCCAGPACLPSLSSSGQDKCHPCLLFLRVLTFLHAYAYPVLTPPFAPPTPPLPSGHPEGCRGACRGGHPRALFGAGPGRPHRQGGGAGH